MDEGSDDEEIKKSQNTPTPSKAAYSASGSPRPRTPQPRSPLSKVPHCFRALLVITWMQTIDCAFMVDTHHIRLLWQLCVPVLPSHCVLHAHCPVQPACFPRQIRLLAKNLNMILWPSEYRFQLQQVAFMLGRLLW